MKIVSGVMKESDELAFCNRTSDEQMVISLVRNYFPMKSGSESIQGKSTYLVPESAFFFPCCYPICRAIKFLNMWNFSDRVNHSRFVLIKLQNN